jgi:hypothetical protein
MYSDMLLLISQIEQKCVLVMVGEDNLAMRKLPLNIRTIALSAVCVSPHSCWGGARAEPPGKSSGIPWSPGPPHPDTRPQARGRDSLNL